MSSEDRKLTREALVVVPLVMVAGLGGLFAFDRCHAKHGHGEGLALVHLDDDTLLAIEAVSISAMSHDVNTGTPQESGWTDYRLRTIDARSGQVIATRVVGDRATCRGAHGRAWCWWKGKLRLLDRSLAIVGERGGYNLDSATLEPDGKLAVLSDDGHAVELDAQTFATTTIAYMPSRSSEPCTGTTVPSLTIGRVHYQLGRLGSTDEERVPLEQVNDSMHPETLAPDVTWLGGSFVDCGSSAPAEAMFIVSRTRSDKQSARQLSRVRGDGTVVWTKPLSEPPSSAMFVGDTIVVSGVHEMTALADESGAAKWSVRH